MNTSQIFYLCCIIGVCFLCLKIYYESDVFQLKCILSSVDGNRYCVRERSKMQEAADLLAETTEKCKLLVRYLNESKPEDPRVKKLVAGFNPKKISETLPTSELTAYSENKGEKLAFCLDKYKKTGETGSSHVSQDTETVLIDLNTLFFVAIHEMAHICTTSVGHKQDFWDNFKFLLIEAKNTGLYQPRDYKKNPQPFCGMDITDNPYYDL